MKTFLLLVVFLIQAGCTKEAFEDDSDVVVYRDSSVLSGMFVENGIFNFYGSDIFTSNGPVAISMVLISKGEKEQIYTNSLGEDHHRMITFSPVIIEELSLFEIAAMNEIGNSPDFDEVKVNRWNKVSKHSISGIYPIDKSDGSYLLHKYICWKDEYKSADVTGVETIEDMIEFSKLHNVDFLTVIAEVMETIDL